MAQCAEDRNEIAVAALDFADAGKGGERLVAGSVKPLAQAGELLRPFADRHARRLQRFVRCADCVHHGGESWRVQMPLEEAERFQRIKQRRQHGHDVVHHGLGHRLLLRAL